MLRNVLLKTVGARLADIIHFHAHALPAALGELLLADDFSACVVAPSKAMTATAAAATSFDSIPAPLKLKD